MLQEFWASPRGKSNLRRLNIRVEVVPSYPEDMDVPIAQDEAHPTIVGMVAIATTRNTIIMRLSNSVE